MNKISIALDAFLDFAAQGRGPRLSDEQVAEVRRRLADTDAATITPAKLRARLFEQAGTSRDH